MHAFTDSQGRTWTLNLTLGSAERVRALVGVDLLAPCEPPPEEAPDTDALPVLTRLGTDLALLCDVVRAPGARGASWWRQADARRLPCEDDCFELVTCLDVLEHLEEDRARPTRGGRDPTELTRSEPPGGWVPCPGKVTKAA